jgi:hypothetical protein
MMSLLILSFDRFHLADAFAVAVFADLGAEPGTHNLAHFGAADRLAPEGQDIGVVVMFARVARHLTE